jgi:hypothetical protein
VKHSRYFTIKANLANDEKAREIYSNKFAFYFPTCKAEKIFWQINSA